MTLTWREREDTFVKPAFQQYQKALDDLIDAGLAIQREFPFTFAWWRAKREWKRLKKIERERSAELKKAWDIPYIP